MKNREDKVQAPFLRFIGLALSFVVLAGFNPLAAHREHISNEELIRRMPVIFVATLSNKNKTVSPASENVLFDSDMSLQLNFINVEWKKPRLPSKSITVYTWLPEKASCTNSELKLGNTYLVFGEYDSSNKYLIANSCGHIQERDTADVANLIRTIDKVVGK